VRWKGEGEISSGGCMMYYFGGEKGARRQAIIMHKGEMRSVTKKIACNDRIIAVKLKALAIIDLLVQVYMLRSEYEKQEVEE
jgi:hypothetical protein